MIFRIAIALALCVTPICASLGGTSDAPPACPAVTVGGNPTAGDGRQLTVICHKAYITALNTHRLVPDWVAWSLTVDQALGCQPRSNAFTADPLAPAAAAVTPKDYLNAHFDRGHFAPDKDFAWGPAEERESFYMTNMSPQAKGLNEQGWEQLEQLTRAWAWGGQHGRLYMIDGPLYGHHPDHIGATHTVEVPAAYWKLIVSPSTGHALAYIMPNLPVTKAREGLHLATIADVERVSGLSLQLPAGVDRDHVALEWPADLAGYAKARKSHCGKD